MHQLILKQHQASVQKVPANQKTFIDTDFGIVNKKAASIFSCVDLIRNDLKPFSFVESEKNSKIQEVEPDFKEYADQVFSFDTFDV